MSLRSITVAAGLALILVSTAAAQNDTIRVNTRLVQVNVIVRDKHGPVRDLKALDFTVLDNKQAQKIDVFSILHNRSTPQQAVPADTRLVSNLFDSAGEVPSGATVILFDMLNTAEQDQQEAIKQLVSYLRTIRPEDRIALYILAHQLFMVQDFTGAAERLTQVAAEIKASDLAGVEIRTPGQLSRLLSLPNFTIGGSSSVWVTLPMVYFLSDASAINQATSTADALQAIARSVKGVPGRKNLVWLSAGFPFAPPSRARRPGDARGAVPPETPDNFSSQLNRASRTLNDANVALYPVDVRSLAGGYPEVMLRLADATGGTVAYHTNDLEGAVREAVADGEMSYLLGFYSTASTSDKTFHSLTVKVNRKDVQLRHRAGYYPETNRPLNERERMAMVGELIGNPLNASEIGLTAHAEPDPSIAGNYRVTVTVNARDIQFVTKNNRHAATLILATRLESSKEKNVKTSAIPIAVPEDKFDTAMKLGIPLTSTLPGTPHDRLRIVVQDRATGFTGALWLPLN
jgi:VWFA-related protein